MGQVIVVFKIMPKDSDSFEVMKEQVLATIGKTEKIEEEYVAFGLKALKVTVLMEDSEGGTDALESKITANEKVGSVELDGIGRI